MTAEAMQRRRFAGRLSEGAIVAAVYLCAQGLMFLDKGVFWDDWVWYRQPWSMLMDVSRQLGSLWPGWTLAAPYQSDAAMWVTRMVAAGAYLLAALWFLGILRELGVDRPTRLVMALCFAVFPVNGARIPIATAPYAVSLALFVGGCRLVVASTRRPSLWIRVGAALALLLSLRTASFGVLIPVVLGYVIWQEGVARAPRLWFAAAVRHAELLVVPLVYVVLRAFVLIPSGAYGDYNAITATTAFHGIAGVPAAMWHSLVAPLLWGASELVTVVGVVSAAIVFGLLLAGRDSEPQDSRSWRRALAWIVAGVALVAVALLPYLLVGKMPALSDFESRHQLLVPFGAALGFGGAYRLLRVWLRRSEVAALALAALLLGGFVAADISNNISYLRERYKHISMMEQMAASPEFRSATTFLFLDRTRELNANRRVSVRDYEYAGMMTETFGDQTRFGVDAGEFASTGMVGHRADFNAQNKMGAYRERPPQYLVEVLPGALDLSSDATVLHLLAVDLANPAKLADATRQTVELRIQAAGIIQ